MSLEQFNYLIATTLIVVAVPWISFEIVRAVRAVSRDRLNRARDEGWREGFEVGCDLDAKTRKLANRQIWFKR